MDLDLLLSLMKKHHIRQADIARATGRSSASVSDWFNKGVSIRVVDALAIADLLGVSVRYLATGKDEEHLSLKEKRLLKICSDLTDEKFDIVLKIAGILSKETNK